MVRYILTLFVFVLYVIKEGFAQDYMVYGLIESYLIPINSRKRNEVYAKCFQGLSLTTCSPNLPDDDVVLGYDTLYYRNLDTLIGQFYCLQCCGTNPFYTDEWDLSCTVDAATVTSTNIYGNELRMARKSSAGDSEIVRCPLKRSACTYEGDETISCDRSTDNTFLHGYTLTLNVKQYDFNFEFWKGVSSCSFIADERNYSLAIGDTFQEKIIMNYKPIDTFSSNDIGKISIITISLFTFLYVALYFFRRKRCEYCQQKLVFSPRLCYKCVIVGAQPPDPVLLKALEERGLAMQGKPPERLGIIQRTCVSFVRCIYNCTTCQCCCTTCACFCRTCCCCCKCCHCCEAKVENKIIPVETITDEQIAEMVEKMDRGEVVAYTDINNNDNSINAIGPETNESDSMNNNSNNKYSKSKRKNSISFKNDKEKKQIENEKINLEKKKKKNPNILEYPPNIIYQAVKHPHVAIV